LLGRAKGEQIRVELIAVRFRETVWRTGVDLQRRVPQQSCGRAGGSLDRHDLIVVAVDQQHRDRNLFQILGEIGLGELLDAVLDGLAAGLHALQPKRLPHTQPCTRIRADADSRVGP
jgi:hypothetical protein